MGKSNTSDGVQPSVGTSKQSRNSVLGFGSGDDYDKLNDDQYADLIDNHVFDINVNNVVHNIYIDHIDKHDNDSGYHHHHGPSDHDILYHPDNECDNEHDTPITIHYDFGSRYVIYGPAKHDHTAAVHDDHDLARVAEHRSG